MPRLLPALAAALCTASVAWGAPQGFGTGVAGQLAALQAQVQAVTSCVFYNCHSSFAQFSALPQGIRTIAWPGVERPIHIVEHSFSLFHGVGFA